jgi:hypothetical protein
MECIVIVISCTSRTNTGFDESAEDGQTDCKKKTFVMKKKIQKSVIRSSEVLGSLTCV